MNLQEIIQELRDTSSSLIKIIEKFVSKNSFQYQKDIIKQVHFARDHQDELLLELLVLVAWKDGVNNEYSDIFCKLLNEDWHYSRENIALMLKDIKDESTVKCLYSGALNIPEFDDFRSLAKKCIWALAAINTEEAKQKLYLLSRHEDPIISEVALQQLK